MTKAPAAPPLLDKLGPASTCEEQFACLEAYLLKSNAGFSKVQTFANDVSIVRVAHESGHQYTELTRLSEGLLLAATQFDAPLPVSMDIVGDEWLRFSVMLSGGYSNSHGYEGEETGGNRVAGLFYLPQDATATLNVSVSDNTIRSVACWCSRQLFAEFVGADVGGLPAPVCQILHGIAPREVYMPIHVTPTMERLVNEILNAPEHVAMKRFFLQYKAFGLLYELITSMRSEKMEPKTGLKSRDATAVSKAYEILLRDFVSPPAIESLARAVGVNRTRLIEGFKEMFGTTIGEFCLELKMDQAWHRLARTDEPISSIAHDLGYEHTANFSTAVKRWFGQTPRQIRQAN